MSTWRSVPGGYDATVRVGGYPLAELEARSATWSVRVLGGTLTGPAGSVGHAKRAAAEALTDALGGAFVQLQSMIRIG